jgi:aspartate aminotransferase-like enzyme
VKPNDLRIPGPTPLPPLVMRAMQRPMISHRSDEFRSLHIEMVKKLRQIHKATGDIFVMPGSGSIGWEAAIVNTLSPGDTVLAFVTGDFGDRFARVAERFGLDTVRITFEPGTAVRPDAVQKALTEHPGARAVLYTFNETSTGVTNPLSDVGPIVREHGALLFVDAVSAAGAIPIETDAWGLDIVFSGSQKAWMCPPGLSIVAVGERAQAAEPAAGFPRSFIDFGQWRASLEKGDTPATAPLTLYYALDAACDLILAEGLEIRAKRHAEAARLARERLCSGGFRLFAEHGFASDTVTAARPPAGAEAKRLVELVGERYHIEVASGQGALADEIIRIGHMGWFRLDDIARTVDAVVACATGLSE